MENLEELISQISKIVLTEKTQQEERSKRGENFNIFKVLGLSTSEVRLHSAFLAELLKPDGSHGMGDSFLRAFLEIVIPDFKNTFDIASLEVIVEYKDAASRADDSAPSRKASGRGRGLHNP